MGSNSHGRKSEFQDKDKPTQIRYSNITAAKGILLLNSKFKIYKLNKVESFLH